MLFYALIIYKKPVGCAQKISRFLHKTGTRSRDLSDAAGGFALRIKKEPAYRFTY